MSFVLSSNMCSRRAMTSSFWTLYSVYLVIELDGVIRDVANLTIEFRHQIRLNYHFIIATFSLTRKVIHDFGTGTLFLLNDLLLL